MKVLTQSLYKQKGYRSRLIADIINTIIMKKALSITLGLILTSSLLGQQFPYQNPGLSSEERAKDLITRLTLDEKATLMCDISDAIPRLGIKKFNWWSEALHGLANNGNVTVFPEPVGMAASFDDQLVYRIFNATSDETRAKYNEAKQKGQENKRFLVFQFGPPMLTFSAIHAGDEDRKHMVKILT